MCMGVGVLVAFQALINISVVSGWCPTTGVTAPFLSYGGSSIFSFLLCTGLLFNICRRNLAAIQQEFLDTEVVPTYKGFILTGRDDVRGGWYLRGMKARNGMGFTVGAGGCIHTGDEVEVGGFWA